eukprot:scaffold63_cov306-Pinguiococcus_pyrenoidosus.AAC.66
MPFVNHVESSLIRCSAVIDNFTTVGGPGCRLQGFSGTRLASLGPEHRGAPPASAAKCAELSSTKTLSLCTREANAAMSARSSSSGLLVTVGSRSCRLLSVKVTLALNSVDGGVEQLRFPESWRHVWRQPHSRERGARASRVAAVAVTRLDRTSHQLGPPKCCFGRDCYG